jgi:hypothetical protein
MRQEATNQMTNNPVALGTEESAALRHAFLESDAALTAFLEHWTQGTLPKAAWTHAAHVAAAAYLAFSLEPEEAFQRMKAGILHHNHSVGTVNTEDSGYHETLTRFWCETIGRFVHGGRFPSRFAAVRAAVSRFGEDRNRHKLFYSFDVVRDRRARREWVPPDQRPSVDA